MLSGDGKGVKRGEFSGFARPVQIDFGADAPNELCLMALRGEHPAQKKKVPGLHRFRIDAEGPGRLRECDAKFFQSLFGAGRPRALGGYHLPACAPPSTCKISPVTMAAFCVFTIFKFG